MKSDIELFGELYLKIKNDLDRVIKEYNDELLKDKKGYLKDNLELFCNLNKDGKLVRGFLIALGYKIANNKD